MTVVATFRATPTAKERIAQYWRHYRWVYGSKLRRMGRAWRYAVGRSRLEDGYELMRHGEEVTGCYSIEQVSTESVMELASYRWADFPELEELASDAAAHVAYKWNSTGDTAAAAEDWALEKIAEYALDRGIELKEVE